jgi:hypothetical protein
VQALEAGRAVGTKALRSGLVLPQATYHVLKAVLLLLGRQPATYDTWPKAQALVGPELFTVLAAYDAQAARDMAVWGKVRACYKAIKGGPAGGRLASGRWWLEGTARAACFQLASSLVPCPLHLHDTSEAWQASV